MEEHKDRFRMYGLVPRNIGEIDKGIQFGHALQEYNNMLGETYGGRPGPTYDEIGDDFNTWRLEDKTFIILNGGTSMTMEEHITTLKDAGIHIGVFREPDLNNMVTGIVFLVPEQVYKKEGYPDFNDTLIMDPYRQLTDEDYRNKRYREWVSMIGGKKKVFLREFTSQFRLA
jgi:hypothetical protein